MAITKINKLPDNVVSSAKIADNTVVNADVNSCAAIAQSKLSGLATSLSNICSSITSATADNEKNNFNIGLLGFKMAVNESLTVFNLIDGVVDEFNDESGTDESEGSNDLYNSTDDYYINSTQPDGQSLCYSAGFTISSTTEPDTSSAGANPSYGTGSNFTYTVPSGITSVNVKVWGAGGSGHYSPGGGGGFSSGCVSVTPGQTLYGSAGEGGGAYGSPGGAFTGGGVGCENANGGAGLSFVGTVDLPEQTSDKSPYQPQMIIIAGSGGSGACGPSGGVGGGLTGGGAGSPRRPATQSGDADQVSGGGGGQGSGGQGGPHPQYSGQSGSALQGGNSHPDRGTAGAAGWFGGGGGGGQAHTNAGGGGGSGYVGSPLVSCGSTEDGNNAQSGGADDPQYQPGTGTGKVCSAYNNTTFGEDGYVLIGTSLPATATSTTIVSGTFSSTAVPTNSRIVVFEENVDTPTLNTDIIASVSRDGGANYTNATLSDSGYVTGSSGQRILTGQADISGQPSGQSMRWKLALANNQVKIHGVSLSWA